jgi:aspartyl-tRNA(Asn)/glutamyl-tRNA(Gln) amidotransferase subunit B
MLEEGERPAQETRLWNENRDVTVGMRSKEESHDYRYFPEPDLPPFRPDAAFMGRVRRRSSELPLARQRRLERELGLSGEYAAYICEEKERADYFEETVSLGAEPEVTAVWMAGDLAGLLNRTGQTAGETAVHPRRLASILRLLGEGRIHGRIAKKLLAAVAAENRDPEELVEERGWRQISSEQELTPLVAEVLQGEQEAVRQARGGAEKVFGYLMGRIMQASGGRAEPRKTEEILHRMVIEQAKGSRRSEEDLTEKEKGVHR